MPWPIKPPPTTPIFCSFRSRIFVPPQFPELFLHCSVHLAVFTVTDPQRRNGHACSFVGCLLVFHDGRRCLLGRDRPADKHRSQKKSSPPARLSPAARFCDRVILATARLHAVCGCTPSFDCIAIQVGSVTIGPP